VLIELLKAFLIGLVEGITEWLPISSTGHMILVDEFVKLDVSADFLKVFLVVIQLGAILAVILLYFRKLNPFALSKTRAQKRRTWSIWLRVIIATIPAGALGFLFDDWVQDHLYTPVVVSAMLVVYGIAFVLMERRNRRLIKAGAEPLGRHSRDYLATHRETGEDVVSQPSENISRLSSPVAAVAEEMGLSDEETLAEIASIVSTGTVEFTPVIDGGSKMRGAPSQEPAVMRSALEAALESASDGQVVVGPDGRKHYVDKPGEDASSVISKVNAFSEMGLGRAFVVGLFQCLAMIPGTSRSGATIIGAMLLGISRTIATEFSFFLAIPIMFGWSLVKLVKHGLAFTSTELAILGVGCLTAFLVSIVAIRFLMGYIKRNDFTAFGWYRIVLGIVVVCATMFL
jgi:undecaprenyl-diphosphatase